MHDKSEENDTVEQLDNEHAQNGNSTRTQMFDNEKRRHPVEETAESKHIDRDDSELKRCKCKNNDKSTKRHRHR
jgi:hypothetical protein